MRFAAAGSTVSWERARRSSAGAGIIAAYDRPVRVRFAPSPTGYLHLGSARTGLYNYIYARQHGGTLILRIEDTDPSRSTDEAIAQIISLAQEMGLDWDEGPGVPVPHGPYRQTERTAIYREYVDKLLASGHLYACFCTPEELEAERQAAQAEKRNWVYSGKCRRLGADEVERRRAAGEPWTLRFKVPPGKTVFDDMIREPVEVDNDLIGDFIVQRSDGTIVYNLAVVVDDVTMDDHPRDPRRRPHLATRPSRSSSTRRSARRCRSSSTCRCSSAPTARSSASGTARPSSNSSRRRACSSRSCATTSAS